MPRGLLKAPLKSPPSHFVTSHRTTSTAASVSLSLSRTLSKMSIAVTTSLLSPQTLPHAHRFAPTPPMSFLRCSRHLSRFRRRFATVAASAVRQDTTLWTKAPLAEILPAAESLFHISIDISDSADLVASHTRPGQYVQVRSLDSAKPAFLAIASPPFLAAEKGAFEFLVKSVEGSTAELLCNMKKGDVVELTEAAGKGFEIDQIQSAENYSSVFIFATGSGISPIRSLIESGFDANKRADVRLYYGARNLKKMAYQDRFRDWESSGVQVVPVLSQPDNNWTGETGYVQAAFARAKQTYNPQSTGVILCGQKAMTEEVTSILVANGVSVDKVLKNF